MVDTRKILEVGGKSRQGSPFLRHCLAEGICEGTIDLLVKIRQSIICHIPGKLELGKLGAKKMNISMHRPFLMLISWEVLPESKHQISNQI